MGRPWHCSHYIPASGPTRLIFPRGRPAAAAAAPPVSSACIHTCSRHTYAHEALSAGMQEGEVMALAGWRSREMLSRYAKSAERERAIAAARQRRRPAVTAIRRYRSLRLCDTQPDTLYW
jgi:hypothetical protein